MSTPPTALPVLDDDDAVELEALLFDLARIPRTRYVIPGRVVDGERTVVVRQGERPWETPSGTRAVELLDQLTTTGTGQARIGNATKSATPAHQRPVPYVATPLALLEQLRSALTSWALATAKRDRDDYELVAKAAADAGVTPPAPPAAPPSLEPAACAGYLLARLPALIRRPGSTRPELDVLRRLVKRGRAMVDRPADRWYAGPCATPRRFPDGGLVIAQGEQVYCEADLYARPGMPVVVCRDCGAKHRVEQRRAELLRLARDRELAAVDVSRALTSLGTPCTPERIRKWKERGRIGVASLDDKGGPLYRVGDVMDLLEADAHRRHNQRKARAS